MPHATFEAGAARTRALRLREGRRAMPDRQAHDPSGPQVSPTTRGAFTLHTVRSRDGTEIAYFRSGTGPPLVAVHGATADHTSWNRVLPFLEPHVSVMAVDRRGRGASGDHPEWHLEREFEDVAAVVDAVAAEAGAPIGLLGHSFGGAISLGAATLTPNVRRLALYEPVTRAEHDAKPAGVVERIDQLVREGKREEALETMFRQIVLMSEDAFAAYRQLPIWPTRVALAHTLPRELGVSLTDTTIEAERVAALRVPTLLLLGGDSPPGPRTSVTRLAETLPNARVSVLEGQEHMAIYDAPETFAERLLGFLRE
jgi:pimeloyl-ACP methyl ester carboxylesterase